MSSMCSSPTADAHHVGPTPRGQLLRFVQLAVRGAGRVADQRARVADVDQVAHELRAFDELHARGHARPSPERQQARGTAHLAHQQRMLRVVGQARVVDPGHRRVAGAGTGPPASALLQWRSMRSGSVSTPCRICQALVGDSAAPYTRSVSMRQRMVKPKSPKVS
jgi:hypothetical protein